MRAMYLFLAIIGAVIPYIFFIGFFSSNGFDLARFIQGLFANGAAGGFTSDVLISSAAFWTYMFYRKANASGPTPWGFIVLNLTIGLSCALPAYLYVTHGRDSAS